MSRIAPKDVHSVIGRHMLADGLEPIADLEKSHGSYIHDPISGKDYLDLFSCFASLPIGWNHPKVLDRKEELLTAAINKPTNSDIYSTQMAEFVDTFATIAKPEAFKYFFFISGGALGIENALKAAFDWKTRKRMEKGLPADEELEVIHFKQAFHGRTGYTMSLTDSADPRKTEYFPKFPWPRITNPKITFPQDSASNQQVIELEEQAIQEIDEVLVRKKENIAALIIEPIQGEGGDNHFRGEFLRQLREICDDHDIMFILDEVQSGVGLTGKFWAYEHFGFQPDMIAFGKKSQVCGFMSTDRIDEVDNNVFHNSNRLNSTWGGNIVDMVRFSMYLEIIREDHLLEAAASQGEYLQKSLREIQQLFPDRVSNARGRGLMCAFDLATPDMRNDLMQAIMQEGALILGSGTQTIRFRPHLNVTRKEIDQGMEIIKKAMDHL